MQWVLKRLFVVTQGEHFIVLSSIAAVVEVFLHSRPLSAGNVKSILLFWNSAYLILWNIFVCNFFSMTNTLQKNCKGMLFVQLNTLQKCAKTT